MFIFIRCYLFSFVTAKHYILFAVLCPLTAIQMSHDNDGQQCRLILSHCRLVCLGLDTNSVQCTRLILLRVDAVSSVLATELWCRCSVLCGPTRTNLHNTAARFQPAVASLNEYSIVHRLPTPMNTDELSLPCPARSRLRTIFMLTDDD